MGFSVSEILEWSGGRLCNADSLGQANLLKIEVEEPGALLTASARQCAFFFSKEFQNELASSRPGILVTGEDFVLPLQHSGLPLWKSSAVIACRDPYFALALLSAQFAKGRSGVAFPENSREKGIHASAVIDPTARIESSVSVGAHCVVEAGAVIGENAVLYPSCFVGEGVEIGSESVLFPNVTLYEGSKVGKRVRLHSGVVIGADGFGYAPRREDGKVVAHQKIYHLGHVSIGDDVEVGANSCIDRGTIVDTVICDQVKIDNQVQIGHNATVGRGAVICGKAGMAGSATLGEFAYVGGLAAIGNKIHVGSHASIGAMALVSKDVAPGGSAVGNPQRQPKEHYTAHILLSRLVKEYEEKRTKKREGKSADVHSRK